MLACEGGGGVLHSTFWGLMPGNEALDSLKNLARLPSEENSRGLELWSFPLRTNEKLQDHISLPQTPNLTILDATINISRGGGGGGPTRSPRGEWLHAWFWFAKIHLGLIVRFMSHEKVGCRAKNCPFKVPLYLNEESWCSVRVRAYKDLP